MNINLLIITIMTFVYCLIGVIWFWYHVIRLLVKFVKFLARKIKKEDTQSFTDLK